MCGTAVHQHNVPVAVMETAGEEHTHLIVSNNFVFELLILQRKFDVIAAPVVVEEFVGHIVFLLEAELHADEREL
jgi:hypothetical protein